MCLLIFVFAILVLRHFLYNFCLLFHYFLALFRYFLVLCHFLHYFYAFLASLFLLSSLFIGIIGFIGFIGIHWLFWHLIAWMVSSSRRFHIIWLLLGSVDGGALFNIELHENLAKTSSDRLPQLQLPTQFQLSSSESAKSKPKKTQNGKRKKILIMARLHN